MLSNSKYYLIFLIFIYVSTPANANNIEDNPPIKNQLNNFHTIKKNKDMNIE